MKLLACLIASASVLAFTPACSKKLYGFKKGQEYTYEGMQHAHWEGVDKSDEDANKNASFKKRWRIVEVGDDYVVANRVSNYVVAIDSGRVLIDVGEAKHGDRDYNVRLITDSLRHKAEYWKLVD